jgi:hypothetical protein
MRVRTITAAALIASAALGMAGFGLLSPDRNIPRVPLSPATELRVLDARVATFYSDRPEPHWKRVGRFFRQHWQFEVGREPSSLWLSVGEFDTARQMFVSPTFADPRIDFGDGRKALGHLSHTESNLTRIEFPVYPRGDSDLFVEVQRGNEPVRFRIRNPERVRPTQWKPQALPQTNDLFQTRLVLEKNPAGGPLHPLRIKCYALGQDGTKWMNWRAQLVDELGNWRPMEMRGTQLSGFSASLSGDCLKVVAQGTEYISAGMVAVPAAGSMKALLPKLRATELGLNSAYVINAGDYILHHSGKSEAIGTKPAKEEMGFTEGGALWTLSVKSRKPGLLLFRTGAWNGLTMTARLRERGGDDRKLKTFHARKLLAATNRFDTEIVALLLPLEIVTDRPTLEAEVIVHHPKAEFYVAREVFEGR